MEEKEDKLVFIDNDLPSNSFRSFDTMRAEGFLCDVAFKIHNRRVLAHRSLLAASSPYLRKMFLKMNTNGMPEVTIPEVDPDVLESLINFSYRCRLVINSDNVESLLTASAFLKMEPVFDACCDFMLRTMHPNNALKVHEFADTHDFSKLKEYAVDYIRRFFVQVSHSESFLDLPFANIRELISRDDLCVGSEEIIFNAVMAWVNKSVVNRERKLPELLVFVRMPLLGADFLSQVATEELIKKSELCVDLVDEARAYHSSPESKSSCSFITKPRHFTSAQLGIEAVEGDALGNFEGRIFCICGNNEEETLNVRYFMPNCERWILSNNSGGMYAADASIAVLGKKIYVIGGCDITGNVLDTVQVLNAEAGTWSKARSMNEQRFNAASVVHNSKIYVFGGVTGFAEDIITRSAECFCPEANEWTYLPEMMEHRLGACAVSLGDHIYVLGGCGGGSDLTAPTDLKTAERYDPETNEWTSITEMTSDLCLRGAATLNGKIYIHGEKYIEVFDPLTDKWYRISYIRHQKSGFSLLPVGRKLYAIGGKKHETDDTPDIVDIYDPENDKWTEGVPLPEWDVFLGAGILPASC